MKHELWKAIKEKMHNKRRTYTGVRYSREAEDALDAFIDHLADKAVELFWGEDDE